MLTTSGFYQLNYAQQADVLAQNGSFLQSRSEAEFVVDLYELDDLLVEIFYQKQTEEPVSVVAHYTADRIKAFGNLQPRLRVKNHASYLRNGSRAA